MYGKLNFSIQETSDEITQVQVDTDLNHVSMEDKALLFVNLAQVLNLDPIEKLMVTMTLLDKDPPGMYGAKVFPKEDGTFDQEEIDAAQALLLNMRED